MTTANTQSEFGNGSMDAVAAALASREAKPGRDQKPAEPRASQDAPERDERAEIPEPPAEGEDGLIPDPAEVDYDPEAEDTDGAEADDGDGRDETPEDARYTVKVDGAEVEVTLGDLKRSYAGQGYIQKRMQEVASVRKEAEAVYTALNQERAQLSQVLEAYSSQVLSAGVPNPPSRELLASDPIGYLEQQVAYQEAVEKRDAFMAQQAQLLAERQQTDARAHQAYLASQAQELVRLIPEIADKEKGGKVMQSLARAGAHYGFSPDELKGIVDARAVAVLHDAAKYRDLMARKDDVKGKLPAATPVMKPGARAGSGTGSRSVTQKARAEMKRTGKPDDVAAFLIAKAMQR